tara:strand:+ start:777 stop:956 length:180 start_codon:yes stop_codon:yes gene_type:complete
MKIALILLAGYLLVDLLANTIYIDIYSDLKQATPYEHCVYAFSGTPNISQCGELTLGEE